MCTGHCNEVYHVYAEIDLFRRLMLSSGASPSGTLWMAAPRPLIDSKQSRGLHSQESPSSTMVATDVSKTMFVGSLVTSGADRIRLTTEESDEDATEEWDIEDGTLSPST